MQEVLLYNAVSDSWIQIRVNGQNHLSMRVSPNIEDWVRVMWIQYMNANVPIDEVVASLITRGFRIEKGLTKDALNHIVSYLTMQETHVLWKESKSVIYKTTLLRALDYGVWKRWFEQDFWVPQGTLFETLGPEEAYRIAYDMQMICLDIICGILSGEYFEQDSKHDSYFFDENSEVKLRYRYNILDFKTILFEDSLFSKKIPVSDIYMHFAYRGLGERFVIPHKIPVIAFCACFFEKQQRTLDAPFWVSSLYVLLSSMNTTDWEEDVVGLIENFFSRCTNSSIVEYKKKYTLFE